MRMKQLKLNTISSFLLQITTFVCGFILPRLILQTFGSSINGLVNSISHFLSFISFLELGVGTVIQSALYKPLADNDNEKISMIIASGNKFFKTIGIILFFYVITLALLFPRLSENRYDFMYTALLIAAISISYFAQYYFGVVDRLLLSADQRGYIPYITSIVATILNTVACIALIKLKASIHIVKLVSSTIFLIRPIFLRIYVDRHYNVNRKIEYEGEPITQKWNGIAQHVAYVLIEGIDIPVLTALSSLENVSIYSIYHLVVSGVKTIIMSLTSGVQSLWGELLAKNEIRKLTQSFRYFEWIIHTFVIIIFGCTSVLIVPFVSIYTKGITDVNYLVPAFARMLTAAHAMHCLRLPYNLMILAGNHFRQTQKNYIISACINAVFSITTVKYWGLVGVAIGTFLAMLYQTIWMAWYDSKHFIQEPISGFIKQIIIDLIVICCGFVLSYRIRLTDLSYISWIIMAVKVGIIWLIISMSVNLLFYTNNCKKLVNIFRKKG